ncbi:tRNA dimethylallyltransferase, mitochondrial [Savitreella phatthalungensis]
MVSARSSGSPVVSIVGTTGVGKSDLAVHLSRTLSPPGEVINSDSLQVYEGLPITTNQMPVSEREEVPHHMLAVIDAMVRDYSVPAYARAAVSAVEDIHKRGKRAIICGGTAYYTTSLLFKDMLPSESMEDGDNGVTTAPGGERLPEDDPRLTLPTAELYARLREVDPTMADRWHPRDTRKIRRALEIFYATGTRQSELYAVQRAQQRLGPGSVRYPTLVLWLWSEQQILDERLERRCEHMIGSGMLDELRALDCRLADAKLGSDYERGILQAIGYKELSPWLATNNPEDLARGLLDMKVATRRYARKQVKWIRNKLLLQARNAGEMIQVVLLDATDLSQWRENVALIGEQAVQDFRSFVAGERDAFDARDYTPKHLHDMLQPKLERELSTAADEWIHRECDICQGFVAVTLAEWERHVGSRSHRGRVARQRKHEAFQAWQQANPNYVSTRRKSLDRDADINLSVLHDESEAAGKA